MRLNILPDHSADECLAEADSLPPKDRVVAAHAGYLETLYRTHRDGLLRFIRRRTRDDRAQDLVQQVFCKLARLPEAERQRIVAPRAYLNRAAVNLLRDHAREAERRSDRLHVQEDEVVLRSHDPLAALEARDRLRRLEIALRELKPRTREIFLAHRIDGYSYAEIARRTGLSIKTIEMHMTRAIAYLDRHRES